MIRKGFYLTLLCTFLSIHSASAQGSTPLKLEEIMQGDRWIGYQPGSPAWSYDSRDIYFLWNPEDQPSDSLFRYNLRNSEITRVSPQEELDLPPSRVSYNRKRDRMVYTSNGDLFIKNLKNGQTRQLTKTLQSASSPSFTADEKAISYTSGNNLFLFHLEEGIIEQLTDFRTGRKPTDEKPSDQDQWLEQQQLALFQVLRERKEKEELREALRKEEAPGRPLPIYTGKSVASNLSVSPGERFVIYWLVERAEAKRARIPHFTTSSGYTEEIYTNPKVGAPASTIKVFVYDLQERRTYPIPTGNIPGIRDVPEYMREYGFEQEQFAEDRQVSISAVFWSPDGKHAAVNIRANDNKDRWIMLLDPATGNLSPLDRQRDEAWVAGPGISVWQGSSSMGWMPDSKRVWFQSEETGYSHLYTIDVTTLEKKALTRGAFEVYNPEISSDGKYWYFSSNEVHPGERHFYRMDLEGGERVQITSMEGHHSVALSPDGKKLAVRYSSYNQPWELYIMDNKPGAEPRRITYSQSEAFQQYNWRIPELLTFTASDGQEVWARLYRPENPQENGPAVMFVHGAGYLQNAHKWWSSYSREYMFHNLLTDLGYTVLDIDYRASSGYGRDYRTGIYRHMGGKDLSDYVDGAQFLINEYGVDPERIGIYGGSYGGFITLMAMFNHPEVFSAGAALRSVTDWAHYNHGYTSNILNTPATDSLAFVRSSPIYFAEGLQGPLLMCHGMVDDNVHFQDIVRLSQRLIELGKENWELAVYPVERHSFTEPTSWTDEYRRILKLFEENLRLKPEALP